MRTNVHACMYLCMHVCAYTSVRTHVCTYVCLRASAYMHVYSVPKRNRCPLRCVRSRTHYTITGYKGCSFGAELLIMGYTSVLLRQGPPTSLPLRKKSIFRIKGGSTDGSTWETHGVVILRLRSQTGPHPKPPHTRKKSVHTMDHKLKNQIIRARDMKGSHRNYYHQVLQCMILLRL